MAMICWEGAFWDLTRNPLLWMHHRKAISGVKEKIWSLIGRREKNSSFLTTKSWCRWITHLTTRGNSNLTAGRQKESRRTTLSKLRSLTAEETAIRLKQFTYVSKSIKWVIFSLSLTTGHFTVGCLVPWPLNRNEAGGDLYIEFWTTEDYFINAKVISSLEDSYLVWEENSN